MSNQQRTIKRNDITAMADKHTTTNHSQPPTEQARSLIGRTFRATADISQRTLDRIVPPDTRQDVFDRTYEYAKTKPVPFAFLALFSSLSFLPIFLFVTFSISVIFLSLSSAVLFSAFWIGVALLALLPTLFVTFSISLFVWAWGVGSYIVARWFYSRVPVGVTGGVTVKAGGKEVQVVKDEHGIDGAIKQ